MAVWRCTVCGYLHTGRRPPKECPQCSSSSAEYVLNEERAKLAYDRRPFDVLLLNGSSHRGHNTGVLADLAEAALRKRGVSYRRYNLNEWNIEHCWCCYSMYDAACTYPCRNQLDDMPAFHEMVAAAKAVIIVTPINWNNMSARLKDFLDRLTCIQNLSLLKKSNLTAGKAIGILVDGHEDGAVKTALDVFVVFQQMGYVFAPFGMAYRTHRSGLDARTDHAFFKADRKIRKDVDGVVNNVVLLMRQGLEKMRPRLSPVCE